MSGALALSGRTVAVPETRELDRLAAILEDDGATTIRCPLVTILDAPDPAPIDRWLTELVSPGFDDLVFLTGEGLRRLLARAETTGVRQAVVAAMGRARRITRGPKPARCLHEIGLAADLPALPPTSDGVMATLQSLSLTGRRMGVQLYGTEPNEALVSFLQGKGAVVKTVAPYVYAPASDEGKVIAVIERMARGEVDVIGFTSASQVDRLFEVAEARKAMPALREGLRRTKIAAIGPMAEATLQRHGVRAEIVPEQPFVMKRLTAAIAQAFG